MRNIETRTFKTASDNMLPLLTAARLDERADQLFSMSVRLEALAIHAQQHDMTAVEIIELMRKEAARFEHSSQELR
ncbi:DUF2732 family protein [Dickeya solani]|uniref:DUF2732 family protein n=1 Tax=Dickeya solani TaxID=1089444 RepID=A0ABU4EE95_9GAMM|nr:DUF2732 family protein [Dickeya solani]MCA7001667.1 DUF2732 domain-containing protein [Dickeya solani]MCZ0821049.1 DUF2732 family protein [Dickeya solani]MDV6997423.1 DUF2732 family protein [Dickeya solani]MDV7003079.1 DUF2732 family protein [Dickeya solani]MDV7040229.1 DUF2732 family protein [Dickeya solani]